MADPNKPTWSFGQTASNPSSGNLFGQPNSSTSKPANSLFGSTTASPASSAANPFATTSTSGGSSLFGGAPGTNQSASFGGNAGGSNLFGGGSKPSEGGLFGQKTTQDKPPSISAPSNLFSGFSTPSKPAEPSTTGSSQAPSLFGGMNTTTPMSKPPPSLFGNSTTPAGPPPNATTGVNSGSSLFGSSTATGGAFKGFSVDTSKEWDSSATTASAQPTSVLGSTSSAGGSDLFGKRPAQAEGGLFQNLNKAQDTGSTKTANASTEAPKANPFTLGALGGQPAAATSSPSTSTATLFGNLGQKPAANAFAIQTQSSANNATLPAAASNDFNILNKSKTSDASGPPKIAPSLFSNIGESPDKASAPTAEKSTAPAATSSLFTLGKPATPAATTKTPDQTTVTNAGQGSTGTNANLGASTGGPLPPSQSRLKNKSMDDIINRWGTDLSKYQKEFQQQAEKVANWDRMLVDNSEKIQKLYGSTLEAERATTEVERQLTAVENDQNDLAQLLDHYEKEVDSMVSTTIGQDGVLSGPDQERERT